MKFTIRWSFLVALWVLSHGFASAREWQIDGKTLDAEFSGLVGEMVFLRKTDGASEKVAFSALSAEDQAYIKERQRGRTSVVSPSKSKPAASGRKASAARGSVFTEILADKLVKPSAAGFEKAALTDTAPDYVAIYFSAGWCGPCHRFTPKLVSFYQEMKARHDNFEIVFVSSDRNERDMLDYMRQFSMPWPALRFNEKAKTPEFTRYAGNGIPCLVIVDANGNVVADSYVDGNYVGAVAPMQTLGRLLEGK